MSNLYSSRRTFLRRSTVLPLASSRVLGANSRINVGIIGVGNLGLRHLRHRLLPLAKEKGLIQVVAACDIYEKAKQRAMELAGIKAKDVHHDYRDMLARRDVDAVVVVTPEHLHHRMTMDALRAVKDVYLEKPMTYKISEAREIAEAVRRLGRVLQVGSQHVSDPRYRLARDVIGKGWIGDVVWVSDHVRMNSLHGIWQYDIEPEATERTIDWDAFLGPAPKRPFSAERYFRWRKYWDYSGGIGPDLMYHSLSPLLLALGPRFPVRVSANGGIYVWKDRETPDTYSMTAEYPSFYVNISGSAAAAPGSKMGATTIFGHEASITFVRGAIHVRPDPIFRNKFRDATGKEELVIESHEKDPMVIRFGHMESFFNCMRSREQPIFDADLGYRVMTAIRLGVDSYRQSRMMAFDPSHQSVIDHAPARPGYEGTGENFDDEAAKLKDGRVG